MSCAGLKRFDLFVLFCNIVVYLSYHRICILYTIILKLLKLCATLICCSTTESQIFLLGTQPPLTLETVYYLFTSV